MKKIMPLIYILCVVFPFNFSFAECSDVFKEKNLKEKTSTMLKVKCCEYGCVDREENPYEILKKLAEEQEKLRAEILKLQKELKEKSSIRPKK